MIRSPLWATGRLIDREVEFRIELRQTADRFRRYIEMTRQRFNTYTHTWIRERRRIERGTLEPENSALPLAYGMHITIWNFMNHKRHPFYQPFGPIDHGQLFGWVPLLSWIFYLGMDTCCLIQTFRQACDWDDNFTPKLWKSRAGHLIQSETLFQITNGLLLNLDIVA
jgi:hypothetical protein